MPFNGTLKRVADQGGKWGILIDTDEKGETWFTIWDRKLAGEDSAEHESVCDVHDWTGKRVRFDVTRGKLKDKDGPEDGERWNSNITEIALEDSGPEKSVRELAEDLERDAKRERRDRESIAQTKRELSVADPTPETPHEHVVKDTDALTTLTMEAIQADLRAHEARAAMLEEVKRLFGEA